MPLGELVTTRGGGTPSKANVSYYGGPIPWITPKDMKTRELSSSQVMLTPAGLANSSAQLIPVNSVLVVTRSGVLKHSLPVAVNRVPAAINQDMRALIPSPNIDADFLALLLAAKAPVILRWVRATTADNFPFNRLLGLPVPLPPLEEQRRLARIMSSADSIYAKRELTTRLLHGLRSSVLASICSRQGERYEQRLLGALADVQGGLQVMRARASRPREVPYLRVANVHRGRLDLTEIKPLGVNDAEVRRCALRVDDLLIVEGHGNAGEIGRAARWDESLPVCVHQNHLIRARCDQDILLPAFAEAYINSDTGRRHLLRAANTTSGLNTITVRDVRSLPIAVPRMDLQHEFVRAVAAIERTERHASRHLAAVVALSASLQARAFAGAL